MLLDEHGAVQSYTLNALYFPLKCIGLITIFFTIWLALLHI